MRTSHRVQALAQEQGLCIADLARKANLSYSNMRTLYYCPHHSARYYTWYKLAAVLGVTVAELVETQYDEGSVSPAHVPSGDADSWRGIHYYPQTIGMTFTRGLAPLWSCSRV